MIALYEWGIGIYGDYGDCDVLSSVPDRTARSFNVFILPYLTGTNVKAAKSMCQRIKNGGPSVILNQAELKLMQIIVARSKWIKSSGMVVSMHDLKTLRKG